MLALAAGNTEAALRVPIAAVVEGRGGGRPGSEAAALAGPSGRAGLQLPVIAARSCTVVASSALAGAGALALAAGRRTSRHHGRIPRKAMPMPSPPGLENDVMKVDRRDWSKELKQREDLTKFEDGQLWYMIKEGFTSSWRKAETVGDYRFTDSGYESKDENGNWVAWAQMPRDVSHLTDAQRMRLIKELRGEIKVNMSEDLENFTPKAEVPPLEQWPFYEIDVKEELKATDSMLRGYRKMDMSDTLARAFFLVSRWKGSNEARRHLGYGVNDGIDDVANMNGSVLALKCLSEQLKRANRFRRTEGQEPDPSDANRLRAIRISVLLGTTKGSACAMWFHVPSRKRIQVDVCIGDDCMDKGPYAEEMLLHHMVSQAAELGCEKLWVRSRRSESARIILPAYMPKMGFTAVPRDQQESEEWETFFGSQYQDEITEKVSGLNLWLSTRGLDGYLKAVNDWCVDMGAADICEVNDNKADLADWLQENNNLTDEERERLVQY